MNMWESLKEKIILLGLGALVSVAAFLLSFYFQSFVTASEFNKYKVDQSYIKKSLCRIEEHLGIDYGLHDCK